MSHKTGKYMECKKCGKRIYVAGWQLKTYKYRFCSTKCYQLWQRGNLYGKNIKLMQEHNRIYGVWGKGLTKETDKRIKIRNEKDTKTNKERGNYKSNLGSFKKGHIPKNPIKKGHKFSKEIEEKKIRNVIRGLRKRPTSFEKKIADLCIENSLSFIYSGNGSFLINFKNPDFVNEKDKVVIELFYSWFKIRDYGSVENYKEFCRRKYNSAGWKVIFIDETEVNINNWKEVCLNKIRIQNG